MQDSSPRRTSTGDARRDDLATAPKTPASASSSELPGVGDSPWFWLALFAGMALVSLLLVQSKFAQRQARLEQRYQNRLDVQQTRAERQAALMSNDMSAEAAPEEPADLPEGVNMRNARARTSLVSLMGVVGALFIVGLVGLFRQRAALAADAAGPHSAESAREPAK